MTKQQGKKDSKEVRHGLAKELASGTSYEMSKESVLYNPQRKFGKEMTKGSTEQRIW